MRNFAKYPVIVLLLLSCLYRLNAQFAPAAGMSGTTAIYKDSSVFVEWATACTINRGWQNIADTSLGYASVGDEQSPLGHAGDNNVVSLGDGGMATLSFDQAIVNGPGFDFAVFENGFPTGGSGLAFLEFGFVEVSSDGIHFYRFPAVSHIQDTTQLVQQGIDCSLVNNLAGKYIGGYGTPFDLQELDTVQGLDINHVTQVRIIDVVGSIQNEYATYDINHHKINDPWPTAFASSGFDLDAVGVLHADGLSNLSDVSVAGQAIQLFPNPAKQSCTVRSVYTGQSNIHVTDLSGKLVFAGEFSTSTNLPITDWSAGLYLITVQNSLLTQTIKLSVE